ncbi:Smr/MutS family protein [Alsobacter sp. R-9]
MTGRRRRVLTADEFALWSHVTQHVHPLTGKPRPAPEAKAAEPSPAAPEPRPAANGPKPAAAAPPARPRPAPAPTMPPIVPLERRLRQRLSRGSHPIDAVIDLHGMRQDEAHGALRSFLGRAQAQGHTVVLVVTGKGGRAAESAGIFEERGVLRRSVPHWLRMPDLRTMVVGFEEAVEHHGGAGALYVRLRRRRGPGASP